MQSVCRLVCDYNWPTRLTFENGQSMETYNSSIATPPRDSLFCSILVRAKGRQTIINIVQNMHTIGSQLERGNIPHSLIRRRLFRLCIVLGFVLLHTLKQNWPEVTDETLENIPWVRFWKVLKNKTNTYLHRPGGAIGESTDCVPFDLFTHFEEHVNLLRVGIALHHTPHNFIHPASTFSTGCALKRESISFGCFEIIAIK